MATKIFLIRHGSTSWNKEYRYCGFVDIGLSNDGKAQAKRLAKRLRSLEVNKVYSSDRKRAIQTASIIFKDSLIERIGDLREIHFGIFEGLTHKGILRRYPEIYKEWIKDPFNKVIPSGESMDIFRKRVVAAFRRIIARHPNQSIAVVCHGGTISALVNHALKSGDFWKYIPGRASLTILEAKNKKLKILMFNNRDGSQTNRKVSPKGGQFSFNLRTVPKGRNG